MVEWVFSPTTLAWVGETPITTPWFMAVLYILLLLRTITRD